MDCKEDIVVIQGVLTSLHRMVGNYTLIKYRGGNESKISKIVGAFNIFLTNQKYLREGKITPKYEMNLRKIHLFLVLNTDFTNNSFFTINSKFSYLTKVVPPLSKCLLANIVWNLDLCLFYSEALYSLPVTLTLELLENCNKCMKEGEPFLVLDQVVMISFAIYGKIFYIRNEHADEDKVNVAISKLLERFTEILQNFITPETEQMSTWPTTEMYKYMGAAIYKILALLKRCFNVFLNNKFEDIHEIYTVNTLEQATSTEWLDKSVQALKKCNICLMSVCEANLQAVTVDVFCSWAEKIHNNVLMQQSIGALAYEVRQQIENFEDCGNLPSMLDSIMIKPKSVEEKIQEASDIMLLKHVVIQDANQLSWFKAVLKHGVLKSETVFQTFKSVIHLCTKEDFLYLLEYGIPFVKDHHELRNLILQSITQLDRKELIDVITEYYVKFELNNLYETDNFDSQMNEVFNKVSCDDKNKLPIKEVCVLLLQNPSKIISRLLIESMKNVDHLTNIIEIFKFIRPICNISSRGSKYTILSEMTLKFLKECSTEPNAEKCLVQLMKKLVENNLLVNNISEELLTIAEHSIETNLFQRSLIILRIIKSLPDGVLSNCDWVAILERFGAVGSKVRWNFFNYSEEKVLIVTELIFLMQTYKNNIPTTGALQSESLATCNPIDLFYIMSENENFLSSVSPGFDRKADRNEQICRLLKILPCCTPGEWTRVAEILTEDTDSMSVLQILIDVILLLSEISKKSCDNQLSLSYCFQQFCVIIKNIIYPKIEEDNELIKTFIKKTCLLVKHLPQEIQNKNATSLIHLFDFSILKTMSNDKDFVYILASISNLEVCKIICEKMVAT